MKSEAMDKTMNLFWLLLIVVLTDCTLYLYAQRKETSEYKMYPAPGVPEHVINPHFSKTSISPSALCEVSHLMNNPQGSEGENSVSLKEKERTCFSRTC